MQGGDNRRGVGIWGRGFSTQGRIKAQAWSWGHRNPLGLAFDGAVGDLDPDDGPFVVVDVGGGSTEVVVGGPNPLTDREREMLRILASAPGETVPRAELTSGGTVNERAVDVQINRLRRKIEHDPANPLFLQAVRGIGYRLVASP